MGTSAWKLPEAQAIAKDLVIFHLINFTCLHDLRRAFALRLRSFTKLLQILDVVRLTPCIHIISALQII